MNKSNNPKISIIVSIYNTEKYLERCIKSLLSQTYKNIEIILIEDGSTDNSKKILEKYENNSKCIVCYNENNMGLAYSRNKGMEIASGEYLGFIDSDDYVDEDYYQKFIDTIIEENADVAICDMKLVYENENNRELVVNCCKNEWNLINIVNNGLVASACNKLFKKNLINKYQFAVGKINEDIAVVIPALVNAKKISYVNDCYYNYIQRNNSIQNSKISERRFDVFVAVDTTLERIKHSEDFNELRDAIIYNQICVFIKTITKDKSFFNRVKLFKRYYQLSKKYRINDNKYLIEYINNSGKKKIYFQLLYKFVLCGFPTLASLLVLMFNIMYKLLRKRSVIKQNISMSDLITLARQQKDMKEEDISISVVIPNYNYEKFLYQRLYSILSQKYKLYEIIILDDCSKDNSRETIDDLYNKLSSFISIKKVYNKENSGSAFKQWKKGFELSKGQYVWIAEADDYCKSNLLKELVKPILNDKGVLISYADTAFINFEGKIKINSIKPEIDIQKTGHWDKSYVNDGVSEIENYAYLNNTIANVSSCIIKNGDYINILNESCEYKQAGDWVFYANIMKKGKVAYVNKTLNYYRVHGNNVSSTMNHQKHLDEIKRIYNKFENEFKLEEQQEKKMNDRLEFLKDCWKVK
jgi:glycosyltransferase involved in cell wall biosynthesis